MASSSWSSSFPAGVAVLVWMAAGTAHANCNLIPAAAKEFRSTLGSVDRTLVAPGNRIAVRVDLACNPTAPGFDPVAANNRAFVRFVPPASAGNPALETELEIPAADLTPANCPVGGTRCDTLLLSFPDAAALDAALAPGGDGRGLTGPVRIRVENLAATLLAEVGPLYDPTLACGEQQPESVFGHLTAVPTPNRFGDLVAATDTTLEATLDGNGNLLIPVDYSAVLPNGPGSAVFRILQASADLDAFAGAPGTPIAIPAARYLRSFNLAGRPIPPVLETTGDGSQVFGTVDAQLSVVRIARVDPDAPGSPLYDLSDRLFSDRGPIVIANANATARESAPLATLSADAAGITFARSEAAEGVDLNNDGDVFDRVPQVIDVQSGLGTGTALAVTEVTLPGFARPVLQSGDGHIAFGASEGRNGYADQNADGDVMDSLLRAFDLAGTSLATGSQTVDPMPVVNGKPLAISNGLVFFRSSEADGATRTTTGLTPTVIAPFQQRGYSISPSVSGDGRFVVFSSSGGRTFAAVAPPNALSHIYLYDRATSQYELIDRTAGGIGGDASADAPSISRDGRYVAYHSEASNLPGADADGGASDVFLYDRQTQTPLCVTCTVPGLVVAINPDLSADATFLAYSADDAILIWERASQTTTYLLAEVPPISADSEFFIEGVTPSISGDGRYVTERFTLRTIPALGGIVLTDQVMRFDRVAGAVDFIAPGDLAQISADGQKIAFQSDTDLVTDDVNLATDAYVWDSALGIERISVNTDGQGGPGGVSIRSSSISDDGRFVAFIDDSGTEVPGSPGNRQIFRYDRATNLVEGVSVANGGAFSDGMNDSLAISGDGQTVAFSGFGTNLAPDTYTDVANVFVRGGVGTSSNAADSDVTDTVLQAYDLASESYRAGARVPASIVSVAAGRAGILSDEAADGGIDRNLDGDATDRVARIVDGAAGIVAETELAASAIAISEAVACIAVNEATQGAGPLNGDGDVDDDVLSVRDLATDQQTNTGITVNAKDLSATGTHCVFTTPELLAPGSSDLNGDGDPFDDVIGTYDIATALPASYPYATADLVAKGDLVAFRVCEGAQGDSDLNFDSDPLVTDECIMHVLTLSNGQVENTQRAATACNLPGCDPFFEPFRVGTTTVSFLTKEEDQSGFQVPVGTPLAVDCKATELPGGCDLSGDADTNDSMISVYNVRSGLSQLIPISDGPSIVGQEVPPFPTEIGDSGVLYVQLLETQVGEDVNGDGVITAVPVLVLVGDADGDGSLDDSTNRNDTCVEVSNPDQADADRDQLGDDACDPAATQTLPGDVPCDVDHNGQIDRNDADLIFGDRGAAARTSDPRDPDGDGAITVLDVSECRALCTYHNCRTTPTAGPACGFGAELAVVMGTLLAARRRRIMRQEWG